MMINQELVDEYDFLYTVDCDQKDLTADDVAEIYEWAIKVWRLNGNNFDGNRNISFISLFYI